MIWQRVACRSPHEVGRFESVEFASKRPHWQLDRRTRRSPAGPGEADSD
jgi:hypothetical protein